MSFATQALKYGWVALASLGALTGTTIYVLNNQRHQVKPEDIIELVLGVTERCLATQISTNPVTYCAGPPSFVRTWYSNVYTTNGVTIYTNVVTNTIGWHFDIGYYLNLDTIIKAIVPLYLNTNTVYDGSTNISYLTVTGLWAELKIGDGTNRFTREPAWTNTFTNWIVNYTSYWPSTNGTATNICYTSDYRQTVNYAESWTATGGHVWVTSSNWASEVVTVTNAATYDYTWQIYTKGLEERYRVLNALKATRLPSLWTRNEAVIGHSGPTNASAAEAKAHAWAGRAVTNAGGVVDPANATEMFLYWAWDPPPNQFRWEAHCELNRQTLRTNLLSTALVFEVTCYITVGCARYAGRTFHDFGAGYVEGQMNKIEPPFAVPPRGIWAEDWPPMQNEQFGGWGFEAALEDWRIYGGISPAPYCRVDWNFNYCTNKYW